MSLVVSSAGRAVLEAESAVAQLSALGGCQTGHTHAASEIASGVLGHARLGTGGGGATKYLREDSTWQTLAAGGDALTTGTLDQFADVTQAAGQTLAITASTTLGGGTHSGTNTGDQDLSGLAVKSANLSDLTNASTARTNLGLGSLATQSSIDAAGVVSGTLAHARLGSGGGGATKFLREDSTWQTPGGGSDPWTYVRLASDFPTTSATAVAVTGMEFAPAANTWYEFEVQLMVRTATATVGPRPGLAWATGLTDGVATIKQTSSATAELTTNGNINAALLCAVGGLPNNTQSYPASIVGFTQAGASPSGTIKVQLASETAGTTVTIKAGSFLKYRTYT